MSPDQNISEAVLELFQDTLDRPIAFHPVFVDLTGSVTAGLLLSQAVYWTKRTTSGDGWFYKTIQQWEEETRLSRREQETARKLLRRFLFWHEERRGIPAQMYFRIDIAALYTELLSIAESRKLDCTKPANKNVGKRQTGMSQSGKHYKGISETTTEITSKTTTTPLSPLQAIPDVPDDLGGGRDFIKKMLAGTMLENADPGRIVQVAQKYNRSREEVETAIDVLDLQYRLSGRTINDPTALLVSALKRGVLVPENYVPRSALEVEEAEMKADEDRQAKETEGAEYRAAAEKLEDIPEEEREEIYAQASERVPAILRNSRRALRSFAIEILVERARTPG